MNTILPILLNYKDQLEGPAVVVYVKCSFMVELNLYGENFVEKPPENCMNMLFFSFFYMPKGSHKKTRNFGHF